MTQTPPQEHGPPPKLWDVLPQIIGKLRDEFLLVTLGILILTVAIGAFAKDVVQDLGRAFFYLLVVLAWLAYLIVRALDAWVKLRTSAPGGQSQTTDKARPSAPPSDPGSQTAHGSQTNIEQSEGPVLSGTFHGPVTVDAQPLSSVSTPSTALPSVEHGELDRLHRILVARFDREELRTLSFTLGVDYDDLPGEGRSAKARELVKYMSRRTGGLDRLRTAIKAERPGALG